MTGPETETETETAAVTQDETTEVAHGESDPTALVEDVSIDGMCGVY